MHQNIEREVKQRTEEMRQQNIELNEAYLSTILALVGAVDMEHGYDKSQSERVGKFAQMIGRRMGVEEARIQRICIAATLHDIGTLAISREMLHKPGPLSAEEAREMRRHPLLAVKMLDSVPWLRDVMPLIRHHHEWYNGDARGYPDNIKGDSIDLGARIIHVADAINAMTSHRPYRKTYSPEKVKEELRKSSGTQFDPQTVGCAVGLMEEMGEEFLHLKPRKHQEIS
jgi:HD-GYP domain-containing protein (c-di-GMP phosphodiesterase class II)